MANYIGNQPSAGEFKHLDSITSQFNGSSVTFALKFNAVSQSIGDASQLIVSLNGVIQEPLTAYTLGTGGSTITFASAPQSGDTCFIVMLGGVGGTATPTDGSVTTAKIASGAVTSSKISIDGDISFPDNDKAVFGAGSDLQIYHDGSHSYISDQGTGNLRVYAANFQLRNAAGAETMLSATPGASVNLFYNAAQKLATTNTGVDVTGITKSTTGFQFGSTTSYLYESASDVVTLRVGSNGPYMRLGSDDGEIGNSSGSTRFIAGTGGAKILLDTNGKVGIGVDNFSVFNGVGGNSMLVIKGSNAATNIANNSNASITIANDDGTANNTAGLHFARADTDDNPHYAGASIVTQFTQAQVTGQYPKADLAFLTSTDANFAPSEKMRISADGRVGIGTDSPSRKLSVHSDDSATGGNVLLVRNANSTAGSFINFIAGSNNAPAIGAKGNDIVFTHDGYSGNELVRIREDGRVGINASSPDFKFNVVGSTNYETVKLYYTETANVTQRLGIAGRNYENNDNIGIIAMYDDGSNCVVNIGGSFTAPDNIEFRTGSASAVRMNVDPNGNLVVGNAGVSFTSDRLQVESPSNEPVASFYRPRNTGGGGLVRFMSDVGGTQTIVAQVTSEGNFSTNGGINFGSISGNVTSKTLDDYEEGTWTPVVRVGSTSGTAVTLDINNAAFYTKIGNLVFVNAQFRRGDATAHGGNLYITGLPFTSKSGTANPAGNMWLDNVSGDVRGIPYVSAGGTSILGVKSGDTDALINVNEFDNGRWIYVTATYQT